MTARRRLNTGVLPAVAVLPDVPQLWSFSSLKDAETCPRRYALARADYPELWSKHGYPRIPSPAAIKGDIVHGALETIVKAMAAAGCPSTHSAEAVAVLRELGGYTAVAHQVLEHQLARFEGNPRLNEDQLQPLRRALNQWLPEAREQIQTYLTRLILNGTAPAKVGSVSSGSVYRHRAGVGDHPEQELVVESLRLQGRVDLLSVGAQDATIFDFKTGAEDPTHHEQLRLYALLWHEDAVVNPDAIPLSRLVAAYPRHEVDVDIPSVQDFSALATETSTRVAGADAAITTAEPEARLGEHCARCFVRGLCAPYWNAGAARTADVPDGDWFDLQGIIVREHGVKSWVLQEARSGAAVLVRTPTPAVVLPIGQSVRILGARRTVDPDEQGSLIASLSNMSEVYRVIPDTS